MGNSQSAGQPPPAHHRLSKPKTNSNSLSTVRLAAAAAEPARAPSPTPPSAAPDARRQLRALLTAAPPDPGHAMLEAPNDGHVTGLARLSSDLSGLFRSQSTASLNTACESSLALSTALPPSDIAQHPLREPPCGASGHRQPLIRRRSLATPGIATRPSPAEQPTLPSTPSGHQRVRSRPVECEASLMPNPARSSASARLDATGSAELDSESSPASPPRAKTPGDMDYSHLGALQLGSLVVINGAPSPASSVALTHGRVSRASVSARDDYFAVRQNGSTPPLLSTAQHVAERRSTSIPSKSLSSPESNLFNPGGDAPVHGPCHQSATREKKRKTSALFAVNPRRITLNLRIVNTSIVPAVRTSAEVPSPNAFEQAPREKDRAMTSSILGGGFTVSPDDMLSHACQEKVGHASNEKTGAEQASCQSPESQACHVCGEVPVGLRPTPSKTDSGYSSGGRMFTPRESSPASAEVSMSWQAADAGQSDPHARRGSQQTADGAATSDSMPQPVSEPNVSTTPSWPLSTPSLPASEGRNGSSQRRLQKRQSLQTRLPPVQTRHAVGESGVPDIPVEIRRNFSRRLSESPAMECLTQTYASAAHTKPATSEDARSPDPALSHDGSGSSWPCMVLEPELAPKWHARSAEEGRSVRRRLSLFRSKAGKREEPYSAVGVVDLGTVASALGGSPYDVALAQTADAARPTQAYQVGKAVPRTTTTTTTTTSNMDAQTAAELARTRSRDRVRGRRRTVDEAMGDGLLRRRSWYGEQHGRMQATARDAPGARQATGLLGGGGGVGCEDACWAEHAYGWRQRRLSVEKMHRDVVGPPAAATADEWAHAVEDEAERSGSSYRTRQLHSAVRRRRWSGRAV